MINLKLPKPKKSDKNNQPVDMEYYEEYPHGLCLTLQNEQIDNLGINLKDCEVGESYTIHAKAKLTQIRQKETEGEGKKDRRIELQITDMEIDQGKKGRMESYVDQQKKGPGE